MGFFTDVNPRRAALDLVRYIRRDVPYRGWFFLAATIPALFLIAGFLMDANRLSKPPPPTVIYFESWPLDRSDEQIKADQILRQTAKDRARERQRDAYRALGRSMGMDMDQIERDAKDIRDKSERDALKQPGT